MFGINPIASLRQRLNTVLATLVISALCCLSGALMTFVFSPAQAFQALRLSRLPVMDAGTIEAAAPGDTLLFTGTLTGNAPPEHDFDFLAYSVEEWTVTVPRDNESKPYGRWETVETVVPALTVELDGQAISIHQAAKVRLSGVLHEKIVKSTDSIQALYEGELLPSGTRRYRGFLNGDLMTVLGKKASDGGVIPEQLFAGDRIAFEESQRQAAQGLFFAGLCAMAMAPIVLIGGLLYAIFGRQR